MATKDQGDFISSDWLDPKPELRLVNGVWMPVKDHVPPSSSSRAEGERKPTSLRERKEREELARAEEEASAPADGDAAEQPDA